MYKILVCDDEPKILETFSDYLTAEIEENILAECNAELIAMAVDNYLSNAIKYACNEKKINVVLNKKGSEFTFTVNNDSNGNTILNDNVWDLLSRADSARNSKDNSAGMGLPICRHVFRLHGYKHWYEQHANTVSFCFSGKTNC